VAVPYNKRTHSCGELRAEHVGQTVILAGWVNSYRDHGENLVFIDLRDREGLTQLRFNVDTDPEATRIARTLRNEYCIAVRGKVLHRGDQVSPKFRTGEMPTGEIEVSVHEIDVLSKSETPPFEISDFVEANEDLRLKYRFLDLRRPKVAKMFHLRSKTARSIREYFYKHGFLEIETPFLTKSTPEGARDYLVPSRVQPGHFYALPQSPQLFKQLFMIAGLDRYAQLVRCFRDEDLRGNRQPEFTQLDLEMAFVKADDVMTVVEGCLAQVWKEVLDYEIRLPLPRMGYAEAMARFGIDRPDTRFGLEIRDVTEALRSITRDEFSVFADAIAAGGVIRAICVKKSDGADKLTRKITDGLTEEIKGMGGGGMPTTKVQGTPDAPEFATGCGARIQRFCREVCAAAGAAPGDQLFFYPGKPADVCKYLAAARQRLGEVLGLIPRGRYDALWVVDFPLLEWSEEENRWVSPHHPFTMPVEEDIPLLATDPGKVRSQAYDLVINGEEMAGGSIRIHRRDVQQRVFELLGISEAEAHAKFEHLMSALRFGPPPHGGIAFGFDRWIMMLGGTSGMRDVSAFPKTQRAVCPLTDAPGEVSEEQLRELGLDLAPEVKAKRRAAAQASEMNIGDNIHKHGK